MQKLLHEPECKRLCPVEEMGPDLDSIEKRVVDAKSSCLSAKGCVLLRKRDRIWTP